MSDFGGYMDSGEDYNGHTSPMIPADTPAWAEPLYRRVNRIEAALVGTAFNDHAGILERVRLIERQLTFIGRVYFALLIFGLTAIIGLLIEHLLTTP